jgi:hypothetical protein
VCLPQDRPVVKSIAHFLPALTFPCQVVGCPRCGYGGSVRLYPHRSCHHSVPQPLLNPMTRCYCLPLLCRTDRFYLSSFPKFEVRFEQLCTSLVRSSLHSLLHQGLCHPPSQCISNRLTPSVIVKIQFKISLDFFSLCVCLSVCVCDECINTYVKR